MMNKIKKPEKAFKWINKALGNKDVVMGFGHRVYKKGDSRVPTMEKYFKKVSKIKKDKKFHKSRPPLLIDKSKINNIKVGNITDDFSVVEKADWVVEAVVERIDIKHQIYEKIFKSRKEGAIVSSNTSSIPIKVLSEKLNPEEKKDFCITHFFNPVRYMGLLEIVKNENNDLDKINSLKKFCEIELGKEKAIACEVITSVIKYD